MAIRFPPGDLIGRRVAGPGPRPPPGNLSHPASAMPTPPTANAPRPRRSWVVTVLAGLTMAASAVLLPVSILSLLMILAGGYGSQTNDPVGFLIVVVAPPLTLVAGVGLLRRWRWARYYLLALLAVIIVANIRELASGGKSTAIRTTASGETTAVEVWSGPNHHSLPIIGVCTAALVVLLLPSVGREFAGRVPVPQTGGTAGPCSPPGGTWRVGHSGRDRMYYEEFRHGAWQRIDIDGEMLTGRAHHVIYFAPPAAWQNYPAWAHQRRPEIIARIKSAFRPPDYEYFGEPTPADPPPAPARPGPAAVAAPGGSRRAALVAALLLWAFSAWMGWLVKSGWETGVAADVWPRHFLRPSPSQDGAPVRFWFLLGVYGLAGLGSAGLAVFILRHAFGPPAAVRCEP